MSGKTCRQQNRIRGRFVVSAAQDDMGAGDVLGMEPEIVEIGGLEGELIVLIIVFPYENLSAIGSLELERNGWLFLHLFFAAFPQIAADNEFGAVSMLAR